MDRPGRAGRHDLRAGSWRQRRQAAGDALFPDTPASPRRFPPLLSALTVLAALVVGTLLQVSRQVGMPLWQTMWAEDGSLFLAEALRAPFVDTALDPYAGYVNLFPRVTAAVAARAPLEWVPALFAGAACATVALVGVIVYRASENHLRSRAVRLGLAGLVVLLPLGASEVLGNVCNSHWYLGVATFWLLLWRPRSPIELTAGSVVLVVAVASDALTVLFAPLAALRILLVRDARGQVFSAAYVVGGLLQLAGVAPGERPATPAPGLDDVLSAYALRVVLTGLTGPNMAETIYAAAGWGIVALALLATAAAFLVAVARPGPQRWLALLALPVSLAYWFVPAYVAWAPHLTRRVPPPEIALYYTRYSIVPVCLLLAVLAAGLDRVDALRRDRPGRAVFRVPAVGLVLVLASGVLIDFRYPNDRSQGPNWVAQFEPASGACMDLVATESSVLVPIAPSPNWVVPLPCDKLLAALPSSGRSR